MKFAAFFAKAFFTSLFSLIFVVFVPGQNDRVKSDLGKSFKKFDVVRAQPSGGTNRKNLKFHAAGREFELQLELNDIRSSRYRAEDSRLIGLFPMEMPEVNTFKGKIAGEAKSEVRVSISDGSVKGFFAAGGERFFIEPAARYSDSAEIGEAVVYREEDSLNEQAFFCESDVPGQIDYGKEMAAGYLTGQAIASRDIEIATEADLEFVTTLGGAAQANTEILAIMNMVEGTFASELDLSISIVYQHTWSTADPFAGASSSAVLTNFQTHWNANFPNMTVPRDAAHLFSAKPNVLSQGIAYLGVMCRRPEASYGLSGYISWAPGKYLVPAHELGHNLGANHAESAQSCANTLMNAQLSGSAAMSFCSFSRSEIGTYLSANSGCLASAPAPTPTPTPTPLPPTGSSARFDFDGDGRSDISLFRPSDGNWYLNQSTAGYNETRWGLSGDIAVSADYDGDGRADRAVYRAGTWYRIRSATGSMETINFGLPGDIPAPADFDGDRKADIALYRPSNGTWYRLSSQSGGYSEVQFGLTGDIPMAGDYDGDGRADIAVFRPSDSNWYRLNSGGGMSVMRFGLLGDKPVSGDFDGDGRADISVWRPSNGTWYMIRSSNTSYNSVAFGLAGDVPTPADYDGDGKTDLSVFRPANGTWYSLLSLSGNVSTVQFGLTNDKPVPSYYLQ